MANISINVRFLIVSLLVLVLLGSAAYLVLDRVYRLQLHEKASVVADNVEAFGRWVAKYGGVWVDKDPDSSHLKKRRVVDVDAFRQPREDAKQWLTEHTRTLYSKNPALAQREFSEVASASRSPAKFRMTSENFMNPNNRPDRFESIAIARIKETGASEYAEFDQESSTYRYARALIHKASCISCHGDPAQAPEAVVERYGTQHGFGFSKGDLAGVISVKLPMEPFGKVVAPFIGLREIGLLLAALLLPLLFLYFSVLRPIRKLADQATRASTGVIDDLDVKGKAADTRNEIDQLVLAVRRLNMSTRISLQRMNDLKK